MRGVVECNQLRVEEQHGIQKPDCYCRDLLLMLQIRYQIRGVKSLWQGWWGALQCWWSYGCSKKYKCPAGWVESC